MEASPHRLDTGGLSQAALRILAALRSESLGAPSDPNHCRPRRQMERFDSQMATWREEYTDGASAEIRPWFILSVSPDHDGPDQLLFPTTQQQNSGRTAPPVDCHQASSGLTDDKFYEHKRESAGNIDSGRTAELNVKESANGIRQSFESDTRNNLAPKLSDSKDKKPGVEGENIFEARAENNCGMEDLPDCGELKEKSKTNVRTAAEEIGPEIKEDKRSKGELQLNSEDIRNSAETSESERLPAPTRANQCVTRRSGFKPPLLCGNQQHNDNAQTTPCDTTLTVTKTNYDPPGQRPTASKVARESHFQLPPLIPSFSMKRKHKALQDQKETPNSKISLTWQIPKREPSFPAPTEPPQGGICEWKKAKMATSVSALRSKTVESAARRDTQQHLKHKNVKKCDIAESKSDREDVEQVREELSASEVRADKAVSLTSDSRVADSEKMNADEKVEMLKKAQQAKVLLLTLVHRDGTTQFDPQRKLSSTVCGLFVLMKAVVHCSSSADDSLGPDDILLYVKLQQTPAWAQQHTHHQSQHSFSRDFLQLLLSSSELVVCYKAKDLLRTALNIYKQHLNWKQVAGCHIQDPQVSAWLLDAADPSSCFQSLLHKHFRRQFNTPALGSHKVTQVISGLNWLLRLNLKLNSDLKNQKLWCLFTNMELKMIPVLAAMESHRIHVDKETLKKTSDLLGTKMKQLEQEAHQAAGQKFLLTSNTQLRTVLFEKLRLHERCENKRLPKTVNKQQHSTSEAALLQLQDLHPLPKIILEYRQVHKVKSTFVDGILSCMMSKSYISSSWQQTSAVTGRISAKHPNFQALPRQPLQITRKQYVTGKEEETVTVHPRAMFVPRKGCTFVAADFCQVELRLLAHFSSDPELLRIFTTPQADVFTMLASQWKGLAEDEVTSEDREQAKRVVYSVVYGAGRERLSGILSVSADDARRFQDGFLQTYRDVHQFIQRTVTQSHKQGFVLSIMGRRRTLPYINSPDWAVRMQAERQAVNFVVQGSAADLCKMAMIRIFDLISSSGLLAPRLIAQLHDELLYEVEDSQVQEFAALVKRTMESLQHMDHLGVHLKVPLKVAVSCGKSWGSMSELRLPLTSPPH